MDTCAGSFEIPLELLQNYVTRSRNPFPRLQESPRAGLTNYGLIYASKVLDRAPNCIKKGETLRFLPLLKKVHCLFAQHGVKNFIDINVREEERRHITRSAYKGSERYDSKPRDNNSLSRENTRIAFSIQLRDDRKSERVEAEERKKRKTYAETSAKMTRRPERERESCGRKREKARGRWGMRDERCSHFMAAGGRCRATFFTSIKPCRRRWPTNTILQTRANPVL